MQAPSIIYKGYLRQPRFWFVFFIVLIILFLIRYWATHNSRNARNPTQPVVTVQVALPSFSYPLLPYTTFVVKTNSVNQFFGIHTISEQFLVYP